MSEIKVGEWVIAMIVDEGTEIPLVGRVLELEGNRAALEIPMGEKLNKVLSLDTKDNKTFVSIDRLISADDDTARDKMVMRLLEMSILSGSNANPSLLQNIVDAALEIMHQRNALLHHGHHPDSTTKQDEADRKAKPPQGDPAHDKKDDSEDTFQMEAYAHAFRQVFFRTAIAMQSATKQK